ncbi:MAG: HesA/MoeB/ThiF family protein [Eubacteriales bacterium]|nr:HesA/MoeB/ThiF family protein [Eubacteriales bacterium]
MDRRFIRNLGALSREECALLAQKRVLVAGCGGLGGHLIELLTRVGVGAILAADADVFEESNFNRQLLSGTSVLGKSKAQTARARALDINPAVDFTAVEAYLDERSTPGLLPGCDAVLDGLDSIPARKMLARACTDAGIPLIYGAIRGWAAQAAVSMPGDGLLELLYPADAALTDKSVLSFTPALCAAMQVSLCVRLLLGRPVETGVVHYVDLLGEEYERIEFR